MKILIDSGHPAHVHLFKYFALEMQKKGNEVLFTCRNKEFEINLLNHYNLPYKSFGKKYNSIIGKIWGIFEFGFKEFIVGLKFKADIFLSHGSMYAAHAAFLLRKPHISLEDTFNFEQVRLYKPFTKAILTANYAHPYMGKNNIKYSGYHELAYLHPNQFKPCQSIIKDLGLKSEEKYCIVRFVSWQASHDMNHQGISLENKTLLVKKLSNYLKVFISSEKELPNELEKYRYPLSPETMHHAIAFSSLVVGESATMVAEGAVLGIPGIYLDNTGRYYTKEMEDLYGIVHNFSESEDDQKRAIEKAIQIIKNENNQVWKNKQKELLSKKIDVSSFLVWFIQSWPKSYQVMKKKPDYQYNFK